MPRVRHRRRASACSLWTWIVALFCLVTAEGRCRAADPAPPPIPHFQKQLLTDQYLCDGIAAGDFNRDGVTDIVAGPCWYEGPAFTHRHAFYPVQPFAPEASPTDSMFSYVHDFNGDGWSDILVLGRVHLHQAFWYENPRSGTGDWKRHFVFHRVQGESPPFLDVDGDGKLELVAHWEGRWGLIQPDPFDSSAAWRFKPVTEPGQFHHFYHGEGVGDLNGDGRHDLIINEGWYEQTPARDSVWPFHPFRFAEKGGAQMFAADVDGDGDADVVTALDAHGWGLAWFEQIPGSPDSTFRRHDIMGTREDEGRYGVAFSQPHALAMADLDGDGLSDLVVGKRRWAHGPAGDVEPMADPVLYWFRLVRPSGTGTGAGTAAVRFEPQLIDRGSGVGVQLTVVDLDRDGRPEILTASKLGAFVFRSR